MRKYPSMRLLYAIVFGILLTNVSSAQNDFASIRKNVNVLANSLKHDLSKTKDTLILEGQEQILRVYTIGEHSGLIDETTFTKNFKLPLANFKNGRYVFVVYESRKRIVFEVNVLNSELTKTVIASAETPIDLESKTNVKEKATVVKLSVAERKAAIRLAERAAKVVKPYNITDKERDGMQSREEMKRLLVDQREKRRAEIKARTRSKGEK